MEVGPNIVTHTEADRAQVHEIDWDAYASQYDLLATNNPSYRENIEILRSLLASFGLPDDPRVCDVGAGTGNYICALAQDLKTAKFWHLDADDKMNEVARAKYESAGLANVEVHCCPAYEAAYPAESFDLVLCINSLYASQPRDEFLRRVKGWLKPGGTFFVIDMGRKMRLWDWSQYIMKHVYREQGAASSVRFFFSAFETLRQNRIGAQGQGEGVYWLHSSDEFRETLVAAGFRVERMDVCYRGYCDLAVCRVD